jgi:hypothetical protein
MTGLAMVVLELASTCLWLLQLRGLAVVVKLGLLALAAYLPEAMPWLLVAVIALSSVFAHAPADVRYFSPLHGRRISMRAASILVRPLASVVTAASST